MDIPSLINKLETQIKDLESTDRDLTHKYELLGELKNFMQFSIALKELQKHELKIWNKAHALIMGESPLQDSDTHCT